MIVRQIDLSLGTNSTVRLREEVAEAFLGGRGLGAYLLYRLLPPGTDPLSPENPLIFSAGPLQGTGAYYSSKLVLSTKSPLTGAYLFSVASGPLGHELRRAGLDALVITGRAADPSYLVVSRDGSIVRSAERFWGLETSAAQEALLADAGVESFVGSCATIGPAGEAGSPLACIVTGGPRARTFGRGGAGAVMAAKNLKGLVIKGDEDPGVAEEVAFKRFNHMIRNAARANRSWREARYAFGSAADVMTLNELGLLPTRNWQACQFEGAEAIAPTEIDRSWKRRTRSCGAHCPSPCAHETPIPVAAGGNGEETASQGPEYETIYAFGSNCGLTDFEAIARAEAICDEAGLDAMSAGCTIAFFAECYEKGLISHAEWEGPTPAFGDAAAVLSLLELMAGGRGVGRLLALGSRRAAEAIPGSHDFSMHVKGLELGGYECRGYWGQALQFAVNPRGGCHHGFGLPARTVEEVGDGRNVKGKGRLVGRLAGERIVYDSASLCAFARRVIPGEALLGLVNAASGRSYSDETLEACGERIMHLERLINTREGFSRADDFLPGRLITEPLREGPNRGAVVPMDELLDAGYNELGWDRVTGAPLPETLRSVGFPQLLQGGHEPL